MPQARPKTLKRARELRREMTRAEVILWTRLKGDRIGVRFRKQHPIGPYIADFACVARKLIVEVDGATHSSLDEQVHDETRRRYLERAGWMILRFWNHEIFDNEEGIVATIRDYVQEERPPPPPSR